MMASNLLKMQIDKTVGIRYDNKNRPDFNRLLFLCPTGRKERMMNLKQLMYFKEKAVRCPGGHYPEDLQRRNAHAEAQDNTGAGDDHEI